MGGVWTELSDTLLDRSPCAHPPSIDDDLALLGIERGDNPVTRELAQYLWGRRGAEHNLLGTVIKPIYSSLNRTNSPTNPTRPPLDEREDKLLIITLTKCGIKIDNGGLTEESKLVEIWKRISEIKGMLFSTYQLDGLSAEKVYRWDNHEDTRLLKRSFIDVTTTCCLYYTLSIFRSALG
jgi:hypothetical protein